MVLSNDDCLTAYGDGTVNAKSVFTHVDYSSCSTSACMLRFYWLAFQGVDSEIVWQVYKDCVPLTGPTSGDSSSTTTTATSRSSTTSNEAATSASSTTSDSTTASSTTKSSATTGEATITASPATTGTSTTGGNSWTSTGSTATTNCWQDDASTSCGIPVDTGMTITQWDRNHSCDYGTLITGR
ncbi:hypothetical protein PC128_g27237 [Phytophthora cactorum]|nr:hypothetical protein PC128_g27237 [Phytophthora cactorum]